MDKLGWILLVAFSGALLPIQAGLNNKMGRAIESPVWASLISFAVGALVLLVYVSVTKTGFQSVGFRQVPWYSWLAGACGACYVTVVLLAFPRLGAALTFGLIVAGQLLISLLLDHFKVLVAEQNGITLYKVFGMLLIVAGVIIIRKF